MTSAWYRGTADRPEADRPMDLPVPPSEQFVHPAGYLAEPGLVDAVNVALHLGQPLLLTGQPGTGLRLH